METKRFVSRGRTYYNRDHLSAYCRTVTVSRLSEVRTRRVPCSIVTEWSEPTRACVTERIGAASGLYTLYYLRFQLREHAPWQRIRHRPKPHAARRILGAEKRLGIKLTRQKRKAKFEWTAIVA